MLADVKATGAKKCLDRPLNESLVRPRRSTLEFVNGGFHDLRPSLRGRRAAQLRVVSTTETLGVSGMTEALAQPPLFGTLVFNACLLGAGRSVRRPVTYLCSTLAMSVW